MITSKEHVRLLKLWQHQPEVHSRGVTNNKMSFNLSFLHPVSTLIITIRSLRDLNTKVSDSAQFADDSSSAILQHLYQGRPDGESGKGHFFYHGDGTYPNYDDNEYYNFHHPGSGTATASSPATLKLKSIDLKLNGNPHHPGLNGGIPAEVLKHSLAPLLHSNSNATERDMQSLFAGQATTVTGTQTNHASGSTAAAVTSNDVRVQEMIETMLQKNKSMKGSQNIFVYPFSLNPEGAQPAGAVNFSKVSHAVLDLHFDGNGSGSTSGSGASTQTHVASGLFDDALGGTRQDDPGWQVDIYALYYNWLQIKDGRALLSFA